MKRRTGDTFFVFCLHIVRDKVTARRWWHVATSAGTWVRRGGAAQQENTWTIVHINVDETDPLLPPRRIPTVFWIACTAYHSVYLTISLQTQPWANLGLGFHIWDQPEIGVGGGYVLFSCWAWFQRGIGERIWLVLESKCRFHPCMASLAWIFEPIPTRNFSEESSFGTTAVGSPPFLSFPNRVAPPHESRSHTQSLSECHGSNSPIRQYKILC